jgi:protein-S-isoprenylcysteine O-methyltransferase Ste14
MSEDIIFRFLFLGLWITFLGIRGYYGRKTKVTSPQRSRRERWDAITKYEAPILVILRVLIIYLLILFIILYTFAPFLISWAQLPSLSVVRWIGVALSILTIPFLIWVGRTLGRHVSGDLELRNGHILVNTGPYSRVRHPMYTVYFVFNITMLLVAANWLLMLLIIFGIFVLYGRVIAEEKMMINQFGAEYRAYMKRTGRLLPCLRQAKDKATISLEE